ncbi:MAG TPA: hypothetical protein VND93_18770 [Myxococcales bacterium]|jgi:hypothetical protein|nr:hypothetical protein [Myxococcales bacterium]
MNRILGALAGAAFLAACGGNDPGSGTQTLYVNATAQSDGSSSGTKLTVEVRDTNSSGGFVQGATVQLIGDRGTTYTLAFVNLFVWQGYYQQDITWEGGWKLRVTRGNDNLEAYIAGPGLTDITAPVPNSTFLKANAQNLTVQWKDELGRAMPNAELSFRRADVTRTVQDTGSYQVDYNLLRAADDERITVRRWVDLTLKGGAAGSKLRAETTAELPIIVQ